MTVAFRSASSNSATGSGTTCAVTLPTGAVDGDYLLAFQSIGSTASEASLTQPGGWGDQGFGGTDGNSGVIQVWDKVALGEGASWTWGKSAVGNMCVAVLAFSTPASVPMDGTPVFDQSITAVTAVSASGITTAFANDILALAISANSGAPTMTVPTGMTNRITQLAGATNALSVFTQTIAAAGATGVRASTLSAAQKWVTAGVGVSNFIPVPQPPRQNTFNRAAVVRASTR